MARVRQRRQGSSNDDENGHDDNDDDDDALRFENVLNCNYNIQSLVLLQKLSRPCLCEKPAPTPFDGYGFSRGRKLLPGPVPVTTLPMTHTGL